MRPRSFYKKWTAPDCLWINGLLEGLNTDIQDTAIGHKEFIGSIQLTPLPVKATMGAFGNVAVVGHR